MNNVNFSARALKGVGVFKNKLNTTQKGKILELKETSTEHYLDFNKFRKDNRIGYSVGYVENNFNRVQRIIGLPDGSSRLVFITAVLKGKDADWVTANNACNAFEIKIKRFFWKTAWKYKNTFVGSIEYDKEHLKFHFHSLLVLKELRKQYSDDEIKEHITSVLSNLEETNEKNSQMVDIRIFPFCVKTNDLGDTIEYLVKTSSRNHNPLERTLLNQKEQQELKEK